jgi:4'-phosphopantetheinyl transferase
MHDEIQVWQANIADAEPFARQLIATLSAQERARGARFIQPEHQQQFLLAHAILRDVLSRHLDRLPEAIRYKKTSHGKPYIDDAALQFNLSHSQDCVVVAVSREHELGVDVENTQREVDCDALVKRFFSAEENDEYLSYSTPEARRLAFYRGWTRKEAYVKAIGLGLSYPLSNFSVSLLPDERRALYNVEGDASVADKWTVISMDLGGNYLSSLAVAASVVNLKTYQWSFCPSS